MCSEGSGDAEKGETGGIGREEGKERYCLLVRFTLFV